MLAKIFSGATVGLDAVVVDVEVDVADRGLPSFTIVGLPDKAVEESKERVRAAIKNTGADFPSTRITVNLAPADLPKEGPAYDLPIALGILIAGGQIKDNLSKTLAFGELSLNGDLRQTNGTLPLTILAKRMKFEQVFLSKLNSKEAAIVSGVKIFSFSSLLNLVRFLAGTLKVQPEKHIKFEKLLKDPPVEIDFAEIAGQEFAKRASEIASAGGHNLFLKGTPGSGKTMLARAMPAILPKLTDEEALEVTKIYSITGNLAAGESIIRERPFRSPHHTTSRIGLIGGGSRPQPGEISLAHRGVLFLDEFPEFPRSVLEALRQPMEDGVVTISRAAGSVTYPANFLLVGAANPCPCGYFGDPKHSCRCLPGQISRYQKRISGPILDRIDLHVDVPSVEVEKLTSQTGKFVEKSKEIRSRVEKARKIQTKRFKGRTFKSNSDMTTKATKEFCPLPEDARLLLAQAVAQMNLSARSYYKVIKVARTIADLAEEEKIRNVHIAESLQYRPKVDQEY